MAKIVGIDLGTTYSAIAIPEERQGVGFQSLANCPGYSVICDRLKRSITPSVVAEDDAGNILVGHKAKGRAGFDPEPIAFSKRWMGEDKTFQLAKQGTLTPVDVAAHVLRHLKAMGEGVLGESIEQAVITVPAYFSLLARQMTEQAAEQAGLKVAQIAQEPVAAALMYCQGDTRESLRVMTYDLGGGTFDVAILEKIDGVISTDSIRSFDGDRFLGGYEFDKELTLWMMDELCEGGYDLRLDPEEPKDRVAWAKLMVYAERAKIALSRSETVEIEEPNTGIVDNSGEDVAISLSISREMFESMIDKHIEETIRLCHRACKEKSSPPIDPDSFDEILLVGGSSRIPKIAVRLTEEFGREPKVVEPNLCVALGAAILAGLQSTTFGNLKLDPIPTETDLPTLTITGRVVPDERTSEVGGLAVRLTANDKSVDLSKQTNNDGAFVFQGAKLRPMATTDFTLTVQGPSGNELASHRFSVKNSESATGGLVEMVPNVLSKPILIALAEGDHIIAPERTPLPFDSPVIHAQTKDKSGVIRVPIMEGTNPLGEIFMDDIPDTLAIGSAVEITLSIRENFEITGLAHVPSLEKKQPITIRLPKPRLLTMQELQGRFDGLQRRAHDAMNSQSAGARFKKAGIVRELKDRLQYAEEMLAGRAPDSAKINDCLDEVEALVRALNAGFKPNPSLEEFKNAENRTRSVIQQALQAKPTLEEEHYDKRLQTIHDDAEKAYQAENASAWSGEYTKLEQLQQEVLSQIPPPPTPVDQPEEKPDAARILLHYREQMVELVRMAKEKGLYARLEPKFEEALTSLKQIDPKSSLAISNIVDWRDSKYDPLRAQLQLSPDDGRLVLVKDQGGGGDG